MQTHWFDQQFVYDGSQLRSLFTHETAGVRGDSIASWIGPCQIDSQLIVDMEDLRAGDSIKGSKMLHFIVEVFRQDLVTTSSFQRLMMAILRSLLDESKVSRSGDDLFLGDGKLSISIATVSPVSGLIHAALNISNEGTPVKTSSLEDLGVDPKEFAKEALQSISEEWLSLVSATQKVKWVK